MSESKYNFGRFVWRELYTSDLEASRRFYGELAGWRFRKSNMPDMEYWLVDVGDREVAGLFQPKGVPPHWNCYVSVPDVDAATATASAEGGKVMNGPMSIPGVGRMATLSDPQGAVFSVFKAETGDNLPLRPPLAGEFCWDSLGTTDLAAAKKFYARVAGWESRSFNGMETFALPGVEGMMGSTASAMTAPPGVPAHWLAYIAVPSLADANARVARLGGKLMMENIAVPTIGTFSVVSDNVGATVAFFESARS